MKVKRGIDLRKEAADRDCQIRLPGICTNNGCVLCHLQYPAGIRGMGQKAPDLLGAWGCAACHDEVDRRTRKLEVEFVRRCMYEAVIRTQKILIDEGKVTW